MRDRPLRLTVGGVLVGAFVGWVPLVAQVPLPEALRAARRVYLERGSGVERAELNRIARDIGQARPPRLTLVAEREQAEIVLTVAMTVTDEGTMVLPLAGGAMALPLATPVAHLTVRRATDGRVLWDDARRGDVRDLVKAFLKGLAESGSPPATTSLRVPAEAMAVAAVEPLSVTTAMVLKDPGDVPCAHWVRVRAEAAAIRAAAAAGRPVHPGPPDPATFLRTEEIMVNTLTGWLQGHFRGVVNLGVWLAIKGHLDEPTREMFRAGAGFDLMRADAIPRSLDTYCAAAPDATFGLVAIRLLRETYPLAAGTPPVQAAPTR